MDFTVVLAQIKPKLGCVADNLTTIEGQIAKAQVAGSDLIVFPELAMSGYFLKDLVPHQKAEYQRQCCRDMVNNVYPEGKRR